MANLPEAIRGLTEQEVIERRKRGLGNTLKIQSSRSYTQIFRENVFNFINNILFALGLTLILINRVSDAVVSVGIILINVVVSVVQEIRAKRTLDRIALLTRPKATVIRAGQEKVVDPAEVVVDDVLLAHPGDQIVVDGEILDGRMDMDESLLTGESDLVRRQKGDTVLSGSFCVSGLAYFQARKVGKDSFANQITKGARAFRRVLTPIQQETNLVIRILLAIAVYFEFLSVVNAVANKILFEDSVRNAIVIAGLVPNGLFVAIALSYALGAVRMAGKGALVQQSNAVESLSNVNVLCLDKTGTLTANQIEFKAVFPLGIDETDLRTLLGDFAASSSAGNRTSEAIAAACPGKRRIPAAEVAFSSERKWSALVFEDADRRGTFVLGAVEMMQTSLKPGSSLGDQARLWSNQGLRVVLFASLPEPAALYDAQERPILPKDLVPLGLVSFSDVLRPEAKQILAEFAQAGVQVKIISGDNPVTVAALARQAGMSSDLKIVSGLDLDALSPEEFTSAAETATIFGRITPQQKEKLVRALREQGHYVAMIGDGVNDVLSLKTSNLGIAMQSGSQAARAVADIVLMGDSFASLPFAVLEGQRIINGMHDILRLFLSRTFFVALAILSIEILGGFPFSPKQSSILALMAVGIPTLFLAAWSRPGPTPKESLLKEMLNFVLPSSLTISIFGLLVFAGFLVAASNTYSALNPAATGDQAFFNALPMAQTALTVFAIFCGFAMLLFVKPIFPFLTGGAELSYDWRPSALALSLFVVFCIFLLIPSMSSSFDFVQLSAVQFLIILASVFLWAATLRWTWRFRLVDRFLSADLQL